MDNPFSHAPKELTNSAMWAWILSSLQRGDHEQPRYGIAKNMLARMCIPAPAPGDVAELHTERSFKRINTRVVDIPRLKGRLDIYLRIGGRTPSILFIENKVDETKPEVLLRQIKGYDDQFASLREHIPGYAAVVYPAYFGYEEWTAEQLMIQAQEHDADFAARLKAISVTDMLAAFEGTDFEVDPVLTQFHSWLEVKKKFVTIRRKARLGAHASIPDVIDAAKSAGFGELLERFIVGYRRSGGFGESTQVRTDIRNINFLKSGTTPITVRWFYNSGSNGLYVGLHTDVQRLTGIDFFNRLPTDFGYEQDQNWIFGYLRTEGDVERFWQTRTDGDA